MLRFAKNRALRRAYAAAAKPALGGPRADAKATNGALAAIFGSGGKATTFAPMSETHAHDAPTEARATAPPTTSVTVLANGATIASENTPGATLACGAYVDCGSAREDAPWKRGFSHALERAAFRATKHRSGFRVTRECETIGANLSASASREQFCFAADALKTRAAETVELLLDCALNPALENHEIERVVENLKTEVKELNENPQALLMEATHATAYAGGLGHALVAPSGDLSHITGDALREFVRENFTAPLAASTTRCDASRYRRASAMKTLGGSFLKGEGFGSSQVRATSSSCSASTAAFAAMYVGVLNQK